MSLRHAPLALAAAPAALAAALVAAPAALAAEDAATARAALVDADGAAVGEASFRALPAGLLVTVEAEGLPPGAHGLHIHETGACSPDFAAAGGHFAPQNRPHGFAATRMPHPGDLPNLHVGEDGRAAASFLDARATLESGSTAILDADGAALVVHAEADGYGETAGAGGRIACGVIEAEG